MTTEVAPGVVAITLRPDDDDSPHVYWARGENGGVLIDAGHGEDDISQRVIDAVNELKGDGPAPAVLLITDRFGEHSGGAAALKAAFPGLVVHAGAGDVDAINAETGGAVDVSLNGGETFDLGGGRAIHAIATPGHVGGSMCYFLRPDGVLFSGDCVLSRGTTAVHLDQGGDMAAYVASLQRLADQNANLLLSFHGTS